MSSHVLASEVIWFWFIRCEARTLQGAPNSEDALKNQWWSWQKQQYQSFAWTAAAWLRIALQELIEKERKFADSVKLGDDATMEQWCDHMNGLDRDSHLTQVSYGAWAAEKLAQGSSQSGIHK